MEGKAQHLAQVFLRREWDKLTERERKVINSLINRSNVSRNINRDIECERSFGERVADGVARFGGSWTFMFIFAGILIFWVVLNSYVLANRSAAFDPYPYILLNLFLSMLASVQAPIIMMSQNRQAARDRIDAGHDYEVNLKCELEIRSLHEKFDEMRDKSWSELVDMQQQQIRLLEKLLREQMKKGYDAKVEN
jgi:uncharacterized membrane protein